MKWHKTVHELFEEQVRKNSQQIAAIFAGQKLTYDELNSKANQLAHLLRQKGSGPDVIVGIMVERSPYMLIAMMAVLKAGGAYLPLDAKYPLARLQYMLTDSGVGILLTQEQLVGSMEFAGEFIYVDHEYIYQDAMLSQNQSSITTSQHLAYVIYTSGSTGRPKGVMIEHKSVVNLVAGLSKELDFLPGRTIVSLATIAFDMAVPETIIPLTTGMTVIIADEQEQRDVEAFHQLLISHKIDILQLTPTWLGLLHSANHLSGLLNIPQLLIGAEPFPEMLHGKLTSIFRGRLYNIYGPTEATVWCTLKHLNDDSLITIGYPMANMASYIVDESFHLQSVGMSGELCISGEGLARGYLNQPELTAEKFIANPFQPGERMYRTGDLACQLTNGEIRCLGRMDHQVKIRGYRIELGEIEACLIRYPGIKEVIVMGREDELGGKYLCAYFVATKELTVGECRNWLGRTLPDYMIPSFFVQIESIPVNLNGKIDRKSLPEPKGQLKMGTSYRAPGTGMEKIVVEIWQEILGIEQIGMDDDFFALGGHSLQAMRLVTKIHQKTAVAVPLKELFQTSTVAGLVEYINKANKSDHVSIPSAPQQENYPLSAAQRRIYFLTKLGDDGIHYNIPIGQVIKGPLNQQRFIAACRQLVERYEAFRTSFIFVNDEISQKIHPEIDIEVECIEMLGASQKILQRVIYQFIRPFDLSQAPLMRIKLVKTDDNQYLWLTDVHHIITDGTSNERWQQEFWHLYNEQPLPTLKVQYKDYAVWQHTNLIPEQREQQKKYWQHVFADDIPLLNMPADFSRPAVNTFAGEHFSVVVDQQLTARLISVGMATGSTLYMVLLSAFYILLSKYSGQDDIVIGTITNGRDHTDLDEIVGMFVNTLALRNRPNGRKTFIEFLSEVKNNTLTAFENQNYQFEELIEELSIKRDISRNPLFDVMFIMDNIDATVSPVPELRIDQYDVDSQYKIAKVDILLTVMQKQDKLTFTLEYCTKLFLKARMERLASHFINILQEIIERPSMLIDEIKILTSKEKEHLLVDFNHTTVDYPKDKTVHELFEEQVLKTPEQVALVFAGQTLTYQQLNTKANQLAMALRKKGVKQEVIVGIMLQRSSYIMISILAILKAGGAYLPLDPDYPVARIAYMLQDSDAKLLLTQHELTTDVTFVGEIMCIDADSLYQDTTQEQNLNVVSKATDLSYVIYTSGSTGLPKGVMIEHGSIVNFIKGMTDLINFAAGKTILCLTTISFDIFGLESLLPLTKGLTVFIADKNEQTDMVMLGKLLSSNKIDMIQMTPSRLQLLLHSGQRACLATVTELLIGGEAFPVTLLNALHYLPGVKIYNVYGPTETTIWSAVKELTVGSPLTIGRPIANTSIYIINQQFDLQPIGVIGELCISGAGLARGYLNRGKLTTEKFVNNPFKENEKMYRTGDLARWLASGEIECLGRMDQQVKIRGYRIELGEIEADLLQYPLIKEAVVVAKTDETDKYLCAYVVVTQQVTSSAMKAYLSQTLPDYMIPTFFVQLEKMPLTANGKIDRNALPDPQGLGKTVMQYAPPSNGWEKMLAKVWQEVLAIENIGIYDDFFAIGGHSLKAMNMLAKLHKTAGIHVPLQELFKMPTIKGLATYIMTKETSKYEAIPLAAAQEYYPLSAAQRRVYFLTKLGGDNINYNIPVAMFIEGQLHRQWFVTALNKLIGQYEVFRTSFVIINNEIVQKVDPTADITIEFTDMIGASRKKVQQAITQFIRPFDLSQAPLLRTALFKLDHEQYLWLADVHHIIADETSIGILERELWQLYNEEHCGSFATPGEQRMPKRGLQYKDYAVWQNNVLASQQLCQQKKYWQQVFAGDIPLLNMTTDYLRPVVNNFAGQHIFFTADQQMTAKLGNLATETGSTLYMVLLTTFYILLAKYSGQDDIVIGSVTAGRRHADLENTVGMFVNTLALRSQPSANKTFIEFLNEVKDNVLGAFENQDYQFEELVEHLGIRRDASRNPLFDVMFILQNTDAGIPPVPGLRIKPYDVTSEYKVAKVDMTLTAVPEQKQLNFNLTYYTGVFAKERMERLASHFINILSEILVKPDVPISHLQMLSAREQEQILVDFNQTVTDYPKEQTLHELFAEQVGRTPDQVAVVFAEQILTYQELDVKSNQLSYLLQQQGVKADSIIGIMVERSPYMLIGILAILKAGGAYLPLDPNYPVPRVEYMLQDSEAGILVTEQRLANSIKFAGHRIYLDSADCYQDMNFERRCQPVSKATDLAYVIYTSGSTGQPKGVMIEHKAVSNFIQGMSNRIDFSAGKTILCLTTISFDIFGLETLLALSKGLKIIIADETQQRDMEALGKVIEGNEVEMVQMTPSRLQLLNNSGQLGCLQTVKEILIGGEAFPPALLDSLCHMGTAKIYNMYGPTETTIWSTVKELSPASQVTIGQPIANTTIYIVDGNHNLQPIGISGELCIGGDGLARGYLNQPELTAKKFSPNPFKAGQRMYRTGDLARWLPNGEIQCLGRMDQQVKIRGYRIELGEIEINLLKHPAIHEVVVVDKTNDYGDYLCAYLVMSQELTNGELRDYLAQRLPEYMIPSFFLQLARIPSTPNGKVARNMLPEPQGLTKITVEYQPPRNEMERLLASIWQEVLGTQTIGMYDNFFEIGGDSIKAILIASKLIAYGLKMEVKHLFQNPTIAQLHSCVTYRKNNWDERATVKQLMAKRTWNNENSAVRWLPESPSTLKVHAGQKNNQFRLFCLPFAGGSAAVYATWEKFLDPDIELCLVELAGRGRRFDETCHNNFSAMLEDVYTAVSGLLDEMPYAIFGHSLGGILGYELARKIERTKGIMPKHLFLSAIQTPDKVNDYTVISDLPDAIFKEKILQGGGMLQEFVDSEMLWNHALPILRADFRAMETYKEIFNRYGRELLTCDLTILGGFGDREVTSTDLQAWHQYTKRTCEEVMFDGGHFFISTNERRITELIQRTLILK